jgi:hypothetical protein
MSMARMALFRNVRAFVPAGTARTTRIPTGMGPPKLKKRSFAESSPLKAACDIFGAENVRFYLGGIPGVFLDKGKATDAKLEQLLTWPSISRTP